MVWLEGGSGPAKVAELVYAQDLGSCAFGRGGSSPPLRTTVVCATVIRITIDDASRQGRVGGYFMIRTTYDSHD